MVQLGLWDAVMPRLARMEDVRSALLLITFGVRGPAGALLYDWFGIRLVFTTAGRAWPARS